MSTAQSAPIQAMSAKQWSALARLHGRVRRAHGTAAVRVSSILLTLPVFAATMVIDYHLIHAALSFVLFEAGGAVAVLALSSALCVVALHVLWAADTSRRAGGWLYRAARIAIPVYLLGFGTLLAFVVLNNAGVVIDDGPAILVEQDDASLRAQARKLATQVFQALKAAGGLIAIALAALAIACLFILSVFVGHACLTSALRVIGRYLDVVKTYRASARHFRDVRAREATCVAALRKARVARRRSDADVASIALAAMTTVADEALAPYRQAELAARLSPLEREEDGADLELPGLRDRYGFGCVDVAAFRQALSEVERALAPERIKDIALSVRLDRDQTAMEEYEDE